MYVPWFGALPFYAPIFLACCGKSKDILWVVHTDQRRPVHLAKNILWINSFSKFKHKLCDFKPWWHLSFPAVTEYVGWCDWDVVHDLSGVVWNFTAAKFTRGWLQSPLFVQRRETVLEYYPLEFPKIIKNKNTNGWEEHLYLPQIHAEYLQDGMTPGVDLVGKAKFAMHNYGGKKRPDLFADAMQNFCGFETTHLQNLLKFI